MALLGFDQPTAEVFVNLATGATLPDGGEVRVFGRPTRAIDDSADWLATVDRFGIVSERAVLLDALSVIQNLAMPFTLEIEPPPDDVRQRAEALAHEVGLAASAWTGRSPTRRGGLAARAVRSRDRAAPRDGPARTRERPAWHVTRSRRWARSYSAVAAAGGSRWWR